jgi:hypothetical protein
MFNIFHCFQHVNVLSGEGIIYTHSMYFIVVFPNRMCLLSISTRWHSFPGKELPDVS